MLYLLDKFAVSDEVYHELTMLCSDLPASHGVKAARNKLNDQLVFNRLSSPYPGAYRCFETMLVNTISTAVSNSYLLIPRALSRRVHDQGSGDGAKSSQNHRIS